ncbi:MAG: hypothetical protein Q8P20_02950 [bacterium]|nr:hypothetical protein [bacterium]
MGNYDRNNKRSGGGFDRGGARKSFGGQRPSGRDGGRPQMHRATCSDCGDSCEVPFKPTGSKPVYCSNCFGNHDGGGRDSRDSRGGSRSGGFGGDRFDKKERHRDKDREMYDVVCSECGKNCQVPFKPSNDKPLFCSDCFSGNKGGNDRGGSKGNNRGGGTDETAKQIKMLNEKMDRLISILDPKGLSRKSEVKSESGESPKKEKEAGKEVKEVEKTKTDEKVVSKVKKTKKAAKKVAKKKTR